MSFVVIVGILAIIGLMVAYKLDLYKRLDGLEARLSNSNKTLNTADFGVLETVAVVLGVLILIGFAVEKMMKRNAYSMVRV